MEKDIIMLQTNSPNIASQINGMDIHSSKSPRPPQAIESSKTSSHHYQRPGHIPVQMVYPAIQKTSDDNRNQINILSDSDAKDHSGSHTSDMEDSNDEDMVDNQEDSTTGRRQRDFVPERMKDSRYWVKRIKNNLAAKRSREKRRMADIVMESKVSKLAQENEDLRSELANIKRLVQDNLVKDTKQGVVLDGRDVMISSHGKQTKFVLNTSSQPIPLIIPTYPNTLTRFPSPPQDILILPQTGLPQSGVPQPGLTQSGLPQSSLYVQSGLPHTGFPQPGLPYPSLLQPGLPQSGLSQLGSPQSGLPQPGLPQPGLPQAVQSVRQHSYDIHDARDTVQGVSPTILSNGCCPQYISSARNMNSAIYPDLEDPSKPPMSFISSVENEIDKSTLRLNHLQNSAAVESKVIFAKANSVSKVKPQIDQVSSVCDAEILPDKVSVLLLESPTSEPKSLPTKDDRKSESLSLSFSETPEMPSPAEINKLPHKLRARFLRSICHQEEMKPNDSEVNTPSNQLTMNNDPILRNIKKETEDDISHNVDSLESECPFGPSNYQWISPKTEFPLNPLRSIEEELEQARNLMPTPSRTMTRTESQAYAELSRAASDLVGARLQSKDFSAPSVRQLTRQRTRDMNQEEKYRDKRVRNNIAAKKCRDAKRLLNEYRSARSNFFEEENVTLRNEVESLRKDVIRLRELVKRKQFPLSADAM